MRNEIVVGGNKLFNQPLVINFMVRDLWGFAQLNKADYNNIILYVIQATGNL